ncbi:dTDP-4-dehydrorhamnose reductase [Actinospica sp.]|uniref:dTDP-4-dehydrorhamnose reductase n=1 Tax=Actinospica sp. TaxID=1872142 RepID=UPI002C7074DA|nr:dTDP-4-dehydrorhamnose reductase [Actinospica sp.]HWG25424.1 dTDP-4-dehydrorhamnose reductase [Actinospica sp.]
MSDRAPSEARWLVVGAGGMLGRDVTALLAAEGVEHVALTRAALDLTDPAAVKAAVAGYEVVANAAAWTDVDGAETHEDEASAINGAAVRNLAAACADSGARLLQPSTDYVFPGDATEPIAEDAPTSPLNAYGRSKLIGEQAVRELLPESGYVVRTAWLYGKHGKNFVATILNAATQREFLDVVDDQQGQPTSTVALARQLLALGRAAHAGKAPSGVYHGTCARQTTWFGLARAAFEITGLDPERVRPTTSDKFVRPAPRPAYSVLGHERWAAAGLAPMPNWRDALREYLTGATEA